MINCQKSDEKENPVAIYTQMPSYLRNATSNDNSTKVNHGGEKQICRRRRTILQKKNYETYVCVCILKGVAFHVCEKLWFYQQNQGYLCLLV